jgi:hypothetical protein
MQVGHLHINWHLLHLLHRITQAFIKELMYFQGLIVQTERPDFNTVSKITRTQVSLLHRRQVAASGSE